MFKAFLLTILAISATRQACAEGCLKCNTAGDCLVADISKNYYLNGKTATKITLDNCEIMSHDGKCSFCKTQYYADNATGKCVAVPTANLVTNCDGYSNATACLYCKTDYYLNTNACVAVETKITNCAAYGSASTCIVCNGDYLLSLDSKSCVASPSINNCGDFTFVKCNTCESGYVLNPNNYLKGILTTDASNANINNWAAFAYSLNSDADLYSQAACQVESTTNCSTFNQGTNTCTACLFGWFLDDKAMCIPFPDEPIENCLHYNSVSSCIQCNSGHYFKNSLCTLIEGASVITNCATYNGSANSVVCTACSANFYLSNNSCVARDKSADQKIVDCATKSVSLDRCAVCASDKILSNDGLQCFTPIANCEVYVSTASGQTLKCATCKSGNYLLNTTVDNVSITTCPAGNIANCKEYQVGSGDNCNLCVNGFLLQNNACTAHNTIAGCTVYSTSTLHTCNVCTHATNFNFLIEERCLDIPEANKIANCNSYTGTLASPNCVSCNTGYYLNSNACTQITIANCLVMDGTLCTACTAGYALNFSALACIAVPGFINDKCSQNSTKDASNAESALGVTCEVCTENAIARNFQNHFVCMSSAETREVVESTNDEHIVASCIKYDEDFECVQCIFEGNKYLNAGANPPSCNQTCASYYHKYLLDANKQLSQFNVCGDLGAAVTKTTVANCEAYAPDLTDADGDHICIQCPSTRLTVITSVSTKYTNIDPSATTLDNFFPSPHAVYPEIAECYLPVVATFISGTQTQTPISNCAYYINIDVNEYACYRCDQGFTGTINATGYISACTRDTKCTTDRYHNLKPFINNISSCHKCTNTSEIPFVAYANAAGLLTTTNFDSFAKYVFPFVAVDFADNAGTEKNIACRIPSAAAFNVASIGTHFPANCGMGGILVNTNGSTDNASNYGTFCAACKPGYIPVYDAQTTNTVTSCTIVDNCKTDTKFFNGCSECATGYILQHDDAQNQKILFNKCLTVPAALTSKLANCYAATADGNNATVCKVCKRGYELNEDDFCEQYQPYQCKTNSFRFNSSSTANTWGWALHMQRTTIGCSECNTGYYAVKLTPSKSICLSSTWITSSVDAISIDNTEYIPFCNKYVADSGNILCKTCDTSYVINGSSAVVITGDKCFANTSIANCEIASSATVCLKCNSVTYGLQNNKCVLGNIANCVAYNFNTNEATVKCTQCAGDYYLNTTTNSCVVGEIHNCKILKNDNAKGCQECNDNHTLVEGILSDYDYCYPKDSSLGCAITEIRSNTLGGAVSCTTCTNVALQLPAVPAVETNQTLCMAFAPIANCGTYNINGTLSESNFLCTKCNTGFYLSNNRCVARINQPAKCIQYHVSKDECSQCDNTSYLADNNKKCTDYPKGILGCRIYSNATTCTACKVERYLLNNACPKVTTAITNCSYYSSSTACSQCASSFVLINNTCPKSTATNCASYTSGTACATCSAGFVLETTNAITNCVARTKTGCGVIDINTPYNCLKCTGNYYLEVGECKTPNLISNCLAYDTKTTCAICQQGYALSADKTSCANNGTAAAYIDGRCTDSQIVSTPVCARCDAGHYFVNGECTGACPTGCLACAPDTNTSCFICNTGFYQNKDGKCTPNESNISNATIMGVMTILVALFSLMF